MISCNKGDALKCWYTFYSLPGCLLFYTTTKGITITMIMSEGTAQHYHKLPTTCMHTCKTALVPVRWRKIFMRMRIMAMRKNLFFSKLQVH